MGVRFSWAQAGPDRFLLNVSTDHVGVGTVHRLAAAIYLLDFNILEGTVRTGVGPEGPQGEDEFLIEAGRETQRPDNQPAALGLLMESLLVRSIDVQELFRQHGRRAPAARSFFESRPEMVFENRKGHTEFYIEAVGVRGLLYHVTRALARHNVDIIEADIRTDELGRAQDTFVVLKDGLPLDEQTTAALQEEIED